jgi:hypothetical protein
MQNRRSTRRSFLRGGTKTPIGIRPTKKKLSAPKHVGAPKVVARRIAPLRSIPENDDIYDEEDIPALLIPLPRDSPGVRYVIFGTEYNVQCTFRVHPSQLAVQRVAADMNPYQSLDMLEHFNELILMLSTFSKSASQKDIKVETNYPDGVNPKAALDPQKVEDFKAVFNRLKHNSIGNINVRKKFERVTGPAKDQEADLMRVYLRLLDELDRKINKTVGDEQVFFKLMKEHLLKEDVAPKSFLDKTCYICGARAYKIEGEMKELIKILGHLQEEGEHVRPYMSALMRLEIASVAHLVYDTDKLRTKIIRLTLCLGELKSSCARCNGRKSNDNTIGSITIGGASISFPDVPASVTLLEDCLLNPRGDVLRGVELLALHGHLKSVNVTINGRVVELNTSMFTERVVMDAVNAALVDAMGGAGGPPSSAVARATAVYKDLEMKAELFLKEVYRQIRLELTSGAAVPADGHHAALFAAYRSFMSRQLQSFLRTELNTCMFEQLLFTAPKSDHSLAVLLSTASTFAGAHDRLTARVVEKRVVASIAANTEVENVNGREGARSFMRRTFESESPIDLNIFRRGIFEYYTEGAAIMATNYERAFFQIGENLEKQIRAGMLTPVLLARITPPTPYTLNTVRRLIGEIPGGAALWHESFEDARSPGLSLLKRKEVPMVSVRARDSAVSTSDSAAVAAFDASIVPTFDLLNGILEPDSPVSLAALREHMIIPVPVALGASGASGASIAAARAAARAREVAERAVPGFNPAPAAVAVSVSVRPTVAAASASAPAAAAAGAPLVRSQSMEAAAAAPASAPAPAAAAAGAPLARSQSMEAASVLQSFRSGGPPSGVSGEGSVSMTGKGGRRARTLRKKLRRVTRRRQHKRTRRN